MSRDNEHDGEIDLGLWFDDEVLRHWTGDHAERLYETKPDGDYIPISPTSGSALGADVPGGYTVEINGSGADFEAVVIREFDGAVVAVVPCDRSYQSEDLTHSEAKRIREKYEE